ncbi:metal ABC transporter substrate-binding protein [Natribaculum luteum]|uniref:Metal ABC transporter substrate-binding protein n=1 Tax=Natribaculum luteum TaxID=1586232 RepID=A0ABD5NV83_9EURY|nr:metal ABC transporter substrate-binding protein [Natribaculum luteum]
MDLSRRSVLTGTAGVAMGSLAGCLGDIAGSSGGDDDGYAILFALAEFTNAVGGDEFQVENPVPVGAMGHGWEPSADLQPKVADSDLFVYLDSPEFAWAQDFVANVEDGDHDVRTVDALEGIDLLQWDHEYDDGHDHGTEDDHDHDDDGALDDHALSHACGHMEGDEREPLSATAAEGDAPAFSQTHQPYAVTLESETGYVTFEGEPGTYAFFTNLQDALAPVDGHAVHDEHGVESCDGIAAYHVVETETGSVTLEVSGGAGTSVTLLAEGVSGHDDHGSEDEHDHGGEDEHDQESEEEHNHESEDDGHDHEGEEEHNHESEDDGHDHDHGEHDPHAWIDPVHAQTMVDTITEALVDVDPDNESYYRDNAEEYKAELQELHEEFEEVVANADHDVAVLAGHDSYQYIGARYGIEFKTPVGVSPDEEPSTDEIVDLIDVIDAEEIDYVLKGTFEDDNLARTLVADSHAEEIAELTTLTSTTQEWNDEGWGYVDQMQEVNLPALRKALGAEE